MVLSRTCNYGILAALYIASRKERKVIPIREISDQLAISFHFLTKILQHLTHAKIIRSFRGPKGGVTLARPVESITLMDIILKIDGPGLFNKCMLDVKYCGDDNPCPFHEHWKVARTHLMNSFRNTTLAEISENVTWQGFQLFNLFGSAEDVDFGQPGDRP